MLSKIRWTYRWTVVLVIALMLVQNAATLAADGYGIGGKPVQVASDGYGIGGNPVQVAADGYGIGG